MENILYVGFTRVQIQISADQCGLPQIQIMGKEIFHNESAKRGKGKTGEV